MQANTSRIQMQQRTLGGLFCVMRQLGYRYGAPSQLVSTEDSKLDEGCYRCGNKRLYVPFTRWVDGRAVSYRPFFYCLHCDVADEF